MLHRFSVSDATRFKILESSSIVHRGCRHCCGGAARKLPRRAMPSLRRLASTVKLRYNLQRNCLVWRWNSSQVASLDDIPLFYEMLLYGFYFFSSPLKVKEDDEVDKLDIKLDVKKKYKVFTSLHLQKLD
ncbi:hypothetical protein JHK86_049985 [Glycine max]|nr:hypothetical protein JHK86_049985 [Glycine max]